MKKKKQKLLFLQPMFMIMKVPVKRKKKMTRKVKEKEVKKSAIKGKEKAKKSTKIIMVMMDQQMKNREKISKI